MWSLIVVFGAPSGSHCTRLIERIEPACVEKLLPYTAVERFAESVICWLSGPREVELHLVPIRPLIERFGNEFRTVVPSKRGRCPRLEQRCI